eukprot:scaffold94248_cov36-Phaeocystis_antarctica.AAC.2
MKQHCNSGRVAKSEWAVRCAGLGRCLSPQGAGRGAVAWRAEALPRRRFLSTCWRHGISTTSSMRSVPPTTSGAASSVASTPASSAASASAALAST